MRASVLAALLVIAMATATATGADSHRRPASTSPPSTTAVSVTVNQGLGAYTLYTPGSATVSANDGAVQCSSQCSVTASGNAAVTLVEHTGSMATFKGWSGACVGLAPGCVIAAHGNSTVTANFAPRLGQLDVVVGGTGQVTTFPAGITCGTEAAHCAATLPEDLALELSPAPATGSTFVGWGGACVADGTGQCSVVVGQHTAVTASFAQSSPPAGPQPLKLAPEGLSLWTTPAFGGPCSSGTVCKRQVPGGSAFVLLSGQPPVAGRATWSGACVGVGDTCPLVMDGPESVTAQAPAPGAGGAVPPRPARRRKRGARPPQPTDYFEASVSGPGKIVVSGYGRCPAGCAWHLPDRGYVTFSAKPARGAHFIEWGLGFCTGRRPICRLKVGPNEAVSAAFGK